jgi:hypothetical protein
MTCKCLIIKLEPTLLRLDAHLSPFSVGFQCDYALRGIMIRLATPLTGYYMEGAQLLRRIVQ